MTDDVVEHLFKEFERLCTIQPTFFAKMAFKSRKSNFRGRSFFGEYLRKMTLIFFFSSDCD